MDDLLDFDPEVVTRMLALYLAQQSTMGADHQHTLTVALSYLDFIDPFADTSADDKPALAKEK